MGIGITQHVSKRRDVNIPELAYEAVILALNDACIGIKDVDALVSGNMHTFEGINCPELWGGGYWGGYGKPVIRITTGGSTGASVAQGAFYLVASGLYDSVLCVAFEKQSDGISTVGLNAAAIADMANWTAYGGGGAVVETSGAIGLFVYQATSYMEKSGCTIDHFDRAAAMLRNNAAKNPLAHLHQAGITAAEIAKSPMISYPLRFGHTCPTSDGACAMVIMSEDKAKRLSRKPVWVRGWASFSEDPAMTGLFGAGSLNIDPAEQRSCKFAAARAYAMAGIKDPRKEIDLAEPYIAFAYMMFIFYERLLLCTEGDAPKLFDRGDMDLTGNLPVGPSGSVISSNAIGAAAMIRIAECVLQIRGEAGQHQVTKKVHTALAHGAGGQANFNGVTVLGDTPNRR
jgi:acetyl-CoA C-acetyltransferase